MGTMNNQIEWRNWPSKVQGRLQLAEIEEKNKREWE
jgi:hypothetical protein